LTTPPRRLATAAGISQYKPPPALRKAARAAYQLGHLPSEQEVLAIADKWRPYQPGD
jgi:hypothetical protein